MKKREFLKMTGIAGAGLAVVPFIACGSEDNKTVEDTPEHDKKVVATSEFTLPELGFALDAIAPGIDAMTMEIHHGKHHAGYVRKLNNAVSAGEGFAGKTLEELLAGISEGDTGVRNNGGGHYNHSMYWKLLKPGGTAQPSGQLLDAINASFGDYNTFSEQFFKASKTRFGSGWGWLYVNDDKQLAIGSTPNQDNPLMSFSEHRGTPVVGVDVWEHAYYLNYQNKRGDYINAFIDLINWDQAAANFAAAMV
jgi:Fe-Mn family superoxide dismutase